MTCPECKAELIVIHKMDAGICKQCRTVLGKGVLDEFTKVQLKKPETP